MILFLLFAFQTFTVVLGEIEIIVEGDPKPYTLGPTGFLSVTPGRFYELKNKSDQDAVISFSRMKVTEQ
jgi:glyoxylate utilization-related uncharacterized protein